MLMAQFTHSTSKLDYSDWYKIDAKNLILQISTRPIARISRRGVTWMSKVYVCMHNYVRLEGLGAWSPGNFDALRVLLRPFWDRSRAVG